MHEEQLTVFTGSSRFEMRKTYVLASMLYVMGYKGAL
jgi:hypothetical protein